MMKCLLFNSRLLGLYAAVAALSAFQPSAYAQSAKKGLKDYYQSYFPIGVAVNTHNITGAEAEMILKNFNSITPENAMKMGPIHPEKNRYFWRDADSIVNFAQKNGLRVRGHALCWHEQTPAWLFKDGSGNQVSKDTLLKRLHDHIFTVVGRYKDKVYAWDVVNEAVDDNPQNLLRNSLWYQICGEDFIIKAFEYAHQADPKAVLFYNDYNTERPEKMERIYTLLKKLKDKGVPVQAVGLQAHWSLWEPTTTELRNTLNKFSSLGLKIQITELDVSVYPWEKDRRALRPGESMEYTPQMEQQQIAKYKEVFQLFREYKKVITGVTFWNISDRYTWLDDYPVRGRKNYPLLFDTNMNPKKAYQAVVSF